MKNSNKSYDEEYVGRGNIIDILLDENNREPLTLKGSSGGVYTFEQIAVIPLRGKIYCVLKPVSGISGVADDEALVFRVNEEKGEEPTLMIEMDELIAIEVFEEYYNLLDKANKKAE